MSAPIVTVTAPTGSLQPGSTVTFTWTVTDADNRTIDYAWEGTDQQGNKVTGTGTLSITDVFTMTTFTLGGISLAIDNANRRATGTVPAAA